ncbi:glycerophosphodiester phosphodiesterase family protein [Aurantimonas marina]|uniref:glycerophosphodiester phosphodiesterase family protein n=1 Tax=Aurantimonas marina TaxID=2780508 RepID=UPI0019D06D63|nr:glycerophosphodiester phosphodiesterase family protein [Aurantimonas marina]
MSPRYDGPLDWLIGRPIAHRGLHDGNQAIAENSIPAAQAAIASGWAIECDVQLSADGTPYIFHDDTLDRLTGHEGAFRATRDAAIQELGLFATGSGIPTVSAFLEMVDGRVPVVMELKGLDPDRDEAYFDRLHPIIEAYPGKLALMSFDAWLIDQVLRARPSRPIGLTAEGTRPEILATHRQIYERGCDFCSYKVQHLPNAFVDWVRTERSAPVICWTVRTAEDVRRSREYCDQMTFEGFAPEP